MSALEWVLLVLAVLLFAFSELLAGVIVVVGFGIIVLVPGAVLAYQLYVFLRVGIWNWLSITEVMSVLGHDPSALVVWVSQIDWVGVQTIMAWLLIDMWSGLVAIAVGAIIAWWGITNIG